MSPTTPVGSSYAGTPHPRHRRTFSEGGTPANFSLPPARYTSPVAGVDFNVDFRRPFTSSSDSSPASPVGSRRLRLIASPQPISSSSMPSISPGSSQALSSPTHSRSGAQGDIRVNIQEIEDVAEKVNTVFFNLLANKKGDYYEAAEEDQQTLDEVFAAVKGHCQNQESGGDIQRFEIHWSKGLVKYRINGREVIRSFDEINESASNEVKALIAQGEQAIVRVNHGRSVRAKEFSPIGKGTQGGQRALDRPSYLASALPTSLGTATNREAIEMLPSLPGANAADRSTQVSAAMSRMGAAEKMIGKMREVATQKQGNLTREIQDLDQQKSTALQADPAADVVALSRQIGEKRHDLGVIEKRLKLFDEGIDGFALNAALAAYPGPNASPQEVLRAVGSVYQQIEEISERLRLQKNEELSSRMWVPDLPLIGRLRNEVNLNRSSYAKDVSELLLSGFSPAEGRYYSTSQKADSVEDFIIRKVFRPGDRNPLDTELFGEIQDVTLKGELEQALEAGVREAQELLDRSIDLSAQADDVARIAEFRRQAELSE